MCLSLFEGGARDRGQIRSSPIGTGIVTSNTAYRHSYLAFSFVLVSGVALVRPLPGFGWGRLSAPPSVAGLGSPWAPPSLCLLVVGAPVGVPSVGGLLPSSFPPSGVPPWGCGVRTSTKRQAKLLGTCLRLLGSSSYFCLL